MWETYFCWSLPHVNLRARHHVKSHMSLLEINFEIRNQYVKSEIMPHAKRLSMRLVEIIHEINKIF